MTKGYAVYYGCIYEGGSVISPIYLDKDKAIKECKAKVRQEQIEHMGMFNRSKKDEAAIRFHKGYKWHKSTKLIENYWTNSVDCVILQEFDIVP